MTVCFIVKKYSETQNAWEECKRKVDHISSQLVSKKRTLDQHQNDLAHIVQLLRETDQELAQYPV